MRDTNPETQEIGAAIFSLAVTYHDGGQKELNRLIFHIMKFVRRSMEERAEEEEQLKGFLSELNISFSDEN